MSSVEKKLHISLPQVNVKFWKKEYIMVPVPDANTPEKGSATPQNVQHDGQLPPNKVSGFCLLKYIQATVFFFCAITSFSQITGLSIAILAMVNNTSQHNQSSVSHESYQDYTGVPVFDWNPEIQGVIISSHAYGGLLTLIPSGYLAGVLGARKVLGFGLVMTSIMTILTPLAASQGMIWIILTRMTQGIFQGLVKVSFPCFWRKWAHPKERSQLFGTLMGGFFVSNVFCFFAGGYISHSLGWPYVFYIFGSFGFVCLIFFYFLVYDNPMSHPYVRDSEKEYIISSLPSETIPLGWSLPIKAMVRSLPLWAIFIATFCQACYAVAMVLMLPILIKNMFDTDIRNNGFLSALPSASAFIIHVTGNLVADRLTSKNIFRPVVLRKIIVSLGMLPAAILCIAVPFVNKYVALSFMIFSFGMQSLSIVALQVNVVENASRYSGFVSGISNSFAQMPVIIFPYLGGLLMNQDPTNGWMYIFFVSSGVVFSGLIFYLIFGRAEIQPWAKERTAMITRF